MPGHEGLFNELTKLVVVDDLFSLVLGGFTAGGGFGLGLFGYVLVVDLVEIDLIANGCFASANSPGNISDTVAFVMECLYFITLVFG